MSGFDPSLHQTPRFSRSACHLIACFLLSGCIGGQTGGEFADDDPEVGTPAGESACKNTRTEVSLYDRARLGFSGEDVLGYAAGTHRAGLIWSSATLPLRFGPEQGAGSIEMEIAYAAGKLHLVDTEFVARGGSSSGVEPAVGCDADRLEIEVTVRLRTGGGAFSETFVGVLTARSPDHAELFHTLQVSSLSGTFFVSAPETFSASTVVFSAQLSPQGFQGSFWGMVEQRLGSGKDGSVGASSVTYATWPSP